MRHHSSPKSRLSTGQLFGMAAVLGSAAALLFAARSLGSWLLGESPETGSPKAPKGGAHPGTGEAKPAGAPPARTGPSPEELVVIAAAVAAVVERPHRILAISVPTEPAIHYWSLEGRRQIYSSHQIR